LERCYGFVSAEFLLLTEYLPDQLRVTLPEIAQFLPFGVEITCRDELARGTSSALYHARIGPMAGLDHRNLNRISRIGVLTPA